jgi:NAD(P)-dependent dehydrogenase (short-subunit alcohol dehydrogenase family)
MNGTALLDGKVALVTGGTQGLGLAIVRAFAAAGARGLAVDLASGRTPLPGGWNFARCDVTDEAGIARAIAEVHDTHGRLDIVVANAGLVPPWRDTEAIDLDEWDRAFAVNARGIVATIKHAVPVMKPGGAIIAMGSTNSWQGHGKQAAYVASKHAVLGIVRAAARDVGRQGIRVNALGPGPVATDALLGRIRQRAEAGGAGVEETLRRYADTPLGRMPTIEDVAGAALFLASDLSAGITGHIVPVDAGASA